MLSPYGQNEFFRQFPALISLSFFQLVHFVNRDSLGLANDFLSLGFIPEGVDVHAVSDALKASFADRTRQSQDFQVLSCTLPPSSRVGVDFFQPYDSISFNLVAYKI